MSAHRHITRSGSQSRTCCSSWLANLHDRGVESAPVHSTLRPSCVEKKSSRRMTGLASNTVGRGVLLATAVVLRAEGRNGAMHNVSISLPGCTTPSLRHATMHSGAQRALPCRLLVGPNKGRRNFHALRACKIPML